MTGYPRLAQYTMVRGSGAPFVSSTIVGGYDWPLIGKVARHSVVAPDVTPLWSPTADPFSNKPEIIVEMRRRNPAITVLAYFLLRLWYRGPSEVRTSTSFADSWHRMLQSTGGFGANAGGSWHWVNYANPATEAGATKLFCDLAASRIGDGLFFDFADAWGLGTSAEHERAVKRILTAIRKAGGPGFLIVTNGDTPGVEDGCLREGFPDKLSLAYPENVRVWRSGRPHKSHDWLQAGTGHTDPTNPDTQRASRFAHGFACCNDMLCSFGPDRDQTIGYHSWWFDHYAVDPKGLPDPTGKYVGWLGEPLGPAFGGTIIQRRQFAGGEVIVNAGSASMNITLPPGLRRIGGPEVGTITVPAKDAAFLVRAR